MPRTKALRLNAFLYSLVFWIGDAVRTRVEREVWSSTPIALSSFTSNAITYALHALAGLASLVVGYIAYYRWQSMSKILVGVQAGSGVVLLLLSVAVSTPTLALANALRVLSPVALSFQIMSVLTSNTRLSKANESAGASITSQFAWIGCCTSCGMFVGNRIGRALDESLLVGADIQYTRATLAVIGLIVIVVALVFFQLGFGHPKRSAFPLFHSVSGRTMLKVTSVVVLHSWCRFASATVNSQRSIFWRNHFRLSQAAASTVGLVN